ncbi:MAG TPA: tetratricopeptide repeat protein [Candidatus Acidoferrum sp.]|nr:tetratricopeptide repeat protein [Candidatus Acidoferrum sp.]
MSDAPSAPGKLPDLDSNEPRLESWGEIAAYLRRDIRTVQRWEHDYGLPVRRLVIGKMGQVYAYRSELDRWMKQRQPGPDGDIGNNGKEAPLVPAPSPVSKSTGDTTGKKEKRATWRWKAALLGLLLLASMGWINPIHDWMHNILFPPQKKMLLFVRPFASLPPDPDQQLFVRGLKDEMITQLGKVDPGKLGVFAPTTSDAEGAKSIADLRSGLLADYVLEGSVRRALDQLRIDAVLIATKDGSQVWSKSYTGNARDILQLQDNVTEDVAKQIRGTLPAATKSDLGVDLAEKVDSRAYKAYLEGRVHWLDRDLLRSKESYERALQIEPGYSRARAGLAMIFLLMGQSPNDALPPSQSVPLAREAAKVALRSDVKNADAYCVMGNIAQSYDHDMPAAERYFQKAIEVDPANVTAHEWYGYFLTVNNRMTEAVQQSKLALELDPASPLLQDVQGEIYYYKRDFDASIQQELKTLEQTPGFLYPRIWLGSAYREKKMHKQALDEFDLARKQSNDSPALLGLYGHALAVAGDRGGAQQVLAKLKQSSNTRFVPALYFAAVYTGLGDKDKTFEWLEKAFEEQDDRLVYLGVDPMADPLRSDPRFQQLIKRLGLQ